MHNLVADLPLATADGVPSDCVVNFDNLHTIPTDALRRHITTLTPPRQAHARRAPQAATGC